MKPQRFEIGQQVTPKRANWKSIGGAYLDAKPGNIYTIHLYSDYSKKYNCWFICLQELNPDTHEYQEDGFDPVISDSVLEAELETIFEHQTV